MRRNLGGQIVAQRGSIVGRNRDIVDLIHLLYDLLDAATRLPAGSERQMVLAQLRGFSSRLNDLFARACRELETSGKDIAHPIVPSGQG
jgi:hypothetical protein